MATTTRRCEPPGLDTAYRWQPRVRSRRCSLISLRPSGGGGGGAPASPCSKSDSRNTCISLLSRPGHGGQERRRPLSARRGVCSPDTAGCT